MLQIWFKTEKWEVLYWFLEEAFIDLYSFFLKFKFKNKIFTESLW